MARRTSALLASIVMICCSPSRRGRRRDDAKLLQHAQLVPAGPVLDPFPAIVKAGDDHHTDVNLATRRRYAEQGACVCSAQREATCYAVALGHDLLHRAVKVGH